MSAPTPPRLLDLAGRHLLRADDLDVSTLESLPTELFPPLFLEAFDGYRTETLKAMVQTWPFVRLPLGALIDLAHVGPLQAGSTRCPACSEGPIQVSLTQVTW